MSAGALAVVVMSFAALVWIGSIALTLYAVRREKGLDKSPAMHYIICRKGKEP